MLRPFLASVVALACAGCTLDFDRFAPLSGGTAEAGTVPEMDATVAIDSTVVVAVDASSGGGTDAVAMQDAPPVDAGEMSKADAGSDASAACTDARSVSFGGHCYFPTTGRANFTNSSGACAAAGAHLVTITSAEEQTAVAAIYPQQDRWIGLSRLANSLPVATSYTWITGEPATFSHWDIGEPNFTGECVRMVQGGAWADNSCNTSYLAICERE
jgi:hypothetical protein